MLDLVPTWTRYRLRHGEQLTQILGHRNAGLFRLCERLHHGRQSPRPAALIVSLQRCHHVQRDRAAQFVGGFLGGFILNTLGVGGAVTGLNLASILVAFIGAVVLLGILRLVRRAR